jgi:MFS family permease
LKDIGFYIEFCPKKHLSKTLVLMNAYWGVGGGLACLFAWIFLNGHPFGPESWRYLVALASLPGILIAFSRIFVPESPRFNLTRRNFYAANSTLKLISKFNCRPLPNGKLIYNFQEREKQPWTSILNIF